MNKKADVVLGTVLVALGVLVIAGQFNVFGDISFLRIFETIILVYVVFKGIKNLNFYEILIPAGFLIVLNKDLLHLKGISAMPVFFATLLISAGLEKLFSNKKGRSDSNIIDVDFH